MNDRLELRIADGDWNVAWVLLEWRHASELECMARAMWRAHQHSELLADEWRSRVLQLLRAHRRLELLLDARDYSRRTQAGAAA